MTARSRANKVLTAVLPAMVLAGLAAGMRQHHHAGHCGRPRDATGRDRLTVPLPQP